MQRIGIQQDYISGTKRERKADTFRAEAASTSAGYKTLRAQSAVAAIPDVGVEVYYGKRADRLDYMAGIMFTVDLPLFQSRRQDKDHAADQARTFEANDQLASTVRDHTAQLSVLLAQYQAAQTRWQRQKSLTAATCAIDAGAIPDR